MLDRNGKAIKLGNRIRIIAEAVNDYLYDNYGDDLPDDVWAEEDSFGTLVDDEKEGLVVKDENGKICWMLDPDLYDDGEREPCLEVLKEELK